MAIAIRLVPVIKNNILLVAENTIGLVNEDTNALPQGFKPGPDALRGRDINKEIGGNTGGGTD